MSHDKTGTGTRRRSEPEQEQGGKVKRTSLIGTIGGAADRAPSTPPAHIRTQKPRSPSSASIHSEDGVDSPQRVIKVPDVAIPMQHGLLKRISAFQSKEDLLEFVSHYHCLLDLINLVTCLYRLAKMSKEASRARSSYLTELQKHPTFQLLLRSISSKLLQAHLNYLHTHSEGIKGVDGRCLANLTWALAKLDLSSDDSALTTELALMVAPFIIRTLDTSSPQGLANMLWSYAKLPVAPPAVVFALVHKITDQLVLQAHRPDGASTFDAQALSNSIWALAHLKSRGMEVDALRHPDLMRFLTELAGAAARAMVRPHATLAPPGSNGDPRLPECQRYLALVEREFSCQALVNIAWSFATLLGLACCQQPAIQQLFVLIHSESLVRLRCTAVILDSGQSLPYVGGGGFNEQALSNAVYAFDKVGLLSGELLGAVFEVSALRLRRGSMAHHTEIATFKPQELCTLLKACHSNIAPPWVFLGSLLRLLSAHPAMADSWTTAERLELHKACQLYIMHQAEAAAVSAMAGRQGVASTIDVNQAVSAAQGLVNSIANSISAAGSLAAGGATNNVAVGGTVGRLSGLGSSPPVYGEGRVSGGAAGTFGGRARSSSGTGFAFGLTGPVGEADVATSTFGQLPVSAAQQGMQAQQMYEQLVRNQQQSILDANNAASSNFALLQQLQQQQQQQQLQQQQQQAAVAALLNANAGLGMGGPLLSCPVCSSTLRQEEALGHVEACLANLETASGLEVLIRQQQQQEAAARWAAVQQQQAAQNQQQQQNLLLARLQQQQAQQNLLAAVAAGQQQQQAQQNLLRLDDFCRMTGAADDAWMLDGNPAASRPPLRPTRRQ